MPQPPYTPCPPPALLPVPQGRRSSRGSLRLSSEVRPALCTEPAGEPRVHTHTQLSANIFTRFLFTLQTQTQASIFNTHAHLLTHTHTTVNIVLP